MSRSQQRRHRRLWAGLLIGVASILLLSIWGLLQRRPPPLRADTHTLYLVNSSQDLSFSSLPAQWHWQALDYFVLAPYHPTSDGLEIDAQIRQTDTGLQTDDAWGIVVGVDEQSAGYLCGVTLYQPIVSSPGWDLHTIQGETTSGVYADFSVYVTVTVTIQQNLITLFNDGKQVAQATATAYHINGRIGLFFSGGSPEVRGFRIDTLA